MTPTKTPMGEIEKGCGKKFFIKRFGDGFECEKSDKEYEGLKKTLLFCGNNLTHNLCPKCKSKLSKEVFGGKDGLE